MSETLPPPALRALLADLRARLDEDLEAVADLTAVRRRQARVEHLLGDLDRQAARVGQAAVVTLAGATGAGKSTLLNALARRPLAEEGEDRPTTRQPVVYAPRDADLSALLAGPDPAPRVVRHDPEPLTPWTGQVLVDAPDLNSVDESHREVVRALAERSDVLVVVMHRQSVVEKAGATFLDEFAGRRRLVFVLNRRDELTPDSTAALLAQVRDLAVERWGGDAPCVLATSARLAQEDPATAGWPGLLEALEAHLTDSALAGLRRTNALGTAGRLAAQLGAAGAEIAGDLEALPAAMAVGLERLTADVAAESTERLELRRADVAALLAEEAARRWEGPGGWAVRAGGLSGLGLAAGALLARRSPLLAAGAAVAGGAADQVQGVRRARRLEAPLAPEPEAFDRLFADALSATRRQAARLTGDPAGLGLPDAAEAWEAVAEASSSAWAGLVARDLPRAAASSRLRWFRLLLDLPVYTLAGFCVVRAAQGFLQAQYLGLDFLLNAALLALVWLVLVRVGVRRLLAFRARRLLAEVVERAVEAIGAATARLSERVGDDVARRREALKRLSALDEAWRSELARDA